MSQLEQPSSHTRRDLGADRRQDDEPDAGAGAWGDEDPVLARLVDSDGAFLRRDVLTAGLDDRHVRRQVRAGRWRRIRQGAYTFAQVWDAADGAQQHRIRTRMAMRVLGPRVVVSHVSACLLHGMPTWGVDLGLVHVTRRDGGAGRTEAGVQHHEALVLDRDCVTHEGLETTAPVRAALEAAALTSVEAGLVIVNGGLSSGLFDSVRLLAQRDVMDAWPGARHLQVVTRLADARCTSPGESRALYLFWSQGLPLPHLQYEVRDGVRLVGTCDFVWPEHGLIVEFDGREKYSKHRRPGESPADVVFREKRREDDLRRVTGWRVIRLTWADLHRADQTGRMLRAALAR